MRSKSLANGVPSRAISFHSSYHKASLNSSVALSQIAALRFRISVLNSSSTPTKSRPSIVVTASTASRLPAQDARLAPSTSPQNSAMHGRRRSVMAVYTEAIMTGCEDPLFTPILAARELRCSVSFLAKARMRGSGPEFIRIGRAIRYSRSALDAYKAANTRVSTAEYERTQASRETRQSNRQVRPRRQERVSTTIHRDTSLSTLANQD